MVEYNLQIINGNQQIDTDFQYEYVIKMIIKRVDVAHFFKLHIYNSTTISKSKINIH